LEEAIARRDPLVRSGRPPAHHWPLGRRDRREPDRADRRCRRLPGCAGDLQGGGATLAEGL